MKLSILIITYNHEKYIAQALESVLSQQVDFDYEIVIGEDCSTDSTRAIVLRYQQCHPGKIRTVLPTINLGVVRNFVQTYHACTGEYVALLEGDDFWTSQTKLQNQVTFLDANPEYVGCFHDVAVVDSSSSPIANPFFSHPPREIQNLKDVTAKFCIPTCSTVFRRKIVTSFPEWFFEMPMCDWPLHVLLAEHGSLRYIPEKLASYRIHAGGVWSLTKRADILERTIYAANCIKIYLGGRYGRILAKKIALLNYEIGTIFFSEKQYKKTLLYTCMSIKACSSSLLVYYKLLTLPLRGFILRRQQLNSTRHT